MRKPLLSILFFLLTVIGYAQSITVTNVSATPVCSGTAVTITFSTKNGNGQPSRYDAGSSFTTYLSTSTGATPYSNLGTFTPVYTFAGGNNAENAGVTTTVVIPAGTTPGTGYKISVGSTGPTFNAATGAGASAAFTITAPAVAGTVSANQTLCSGTQPANISIGTSTGSIQWQSSANNSTFTNIAGQTGNTLTGASIGILTATRYFRAVVTNSPCAAVNSAVVTVNVNAAAAAGTVSANQTICSGSQPTNISIGASTGSIQWQSSTNNITFNNIAGQTGNTLTGASIGVLTATRYFRAVVTNSPCAAVNSAVVTVNVTAPSVGGTVTGGATGCAFANSGTITLSNYTGNITKWQSSDLSNFSVGVLDIPNTSATLSYLNLSGTTYYRAVVVNGVCAPAFSAVAEILVNDAVAGGAVSGSTTVCYGNNNGSLVLNGQSGDIIGWESSINNFATAGIPIANTTTTLNYSNLLTTTYYRAVISGGACGLAYSAVAVVTVDTNSIWTGAVSNSWHDQANWSCGVVPTSNINVTITATANQPQITSNAFANTLTLDPGTTLLVTSGTDFRVVNAILGLSGALLTIENNANLIQETDTDNTVIASVTRASNPLRRLDYTLWSSPVDNQNLLAFSSLTVPTRFYTYNSATNLYNTIVPSTNSFAEGSGYLIRMPDNHPTAPTTWNGVFQGVLRNGTVSLNVTNNTYNAIGNPYASTIDADQFIIENGLSEALYFWRKTNNAATSSYATYTLAGGAGTDSNNGDAQGLIPNGIIQVGQGFIAKSTSNTLTFNNGMRIGNNDNQFFRTNEIERNRIWLNLTNTAGIFSQTMVAYMTGATSGVDAAIDGLYFNDSQVALTSLIGTTEYAVQGRALPFDNTDTVPLGFKAITAGTYSIGLDHADGLFANETQNIFLKDHVTDTLHDLRTGPYTFDSEVGAFQNRFELVYQTTLGVRQPVWDASQVIVYKQSNVVVVNSGRELMAKVQLFDIRGRLLVEHNNVNASEATLNPGSAQQVLIVKITAEDGRVVTKKLIN